jgi:hypothetical protein
MEGVSTSCLYTVYQIRVKVPVLSQCHLQVEHGAFTFRDRPIECRILDNKVTMFHISVDRST